MIFHVAIFHRRRVTKILPLTLPASTTLSNFRPHWASLIRIWGCILSFFYILNLAALCLLHNFAIIAPELNERFPSRHWQIVKEKDKISLKLQLIRPPSPAISQICILATSNSNASFGGAPRGAVISCFKRKGINLVISYQRPSSKTLYFFVNAAPKTTQKKN